MDILQFLLLSVIQGLTEFLPVSSSAHLILVSEFLGKENQGIAFDVGVHFGTLPAAIIYFRSDINKMFKTILSEPLSVKKNSLSINLLIAVLPVLVLGFLFRDLIDLGLRNSLVIAHATIWFGVLLYFSHIISKRKKQKKDINSLTILEAFIIGLFQCLALIPGTSRSGITITAGLFLGLNATAASRFSFLLAIPTIGAITLSELVRTQYTEISLNFLELALASSLSFLVAYLTIGTFLKLIERIGFTPFFIYRLLLGCWLLFYWT